MKVVPNINKHIDKIGGKHNLSLDDLYGVIEEIKQHLTYIQNGYSNMSRSQRGERVGNYPKGMYVFDSDDLKQLKEFHLEIINNRLELIKN